MLSSLKIKTSHFSHSGMNLSTSFKQILLFAAITAFIFLLFYVVGARKASGEWSGSLQQPYLLNCTKLLWWDLGVLSVCMVCIKVLTFTIRAL